MINSQSINKRVLIAAGIILIIIVVVLVLRLIGLNNQKTTGSPSEDGGSQTDTYTSTYDNDSSNESGDGTSTPEQTEPLNEIGTTETATDTIEKIEKAREKVVEKAIDTTPRGDVLFYNSNDFQLVYFSKEDEYLISILSPQFEETRQAAEIAFLATLGLSKRTACDMDVIVSTTISVNPDLGGQIFPLSFCN